MTGPNQRPPTDYRRNRRQNERRLLYAVLAVLVLVGGGLITLIWGPGAGLSGLVCLLGGAGLIVALWLVLTLVERWAGD